MKKTLRNMVFATSVVLLSAGSLHATATGCDPVPKTGKRAAMVMMAILSYFGF